MGKGWGRGGEGVGKGWGRGGEGVGKGWGRGGKGVGKGWGNGGKEWGKGVDARVGTDDQKMNRKTHTKNRHAGNIYDDCRILICHGLKAN